MRASDDRSKSESDPMATAVRRLLIVGSTTTGLLTMLVGAVALLAGMGVLASLSFAASVAITGSLAVYMTRRSLRRAVPVKVRRH
jgi:hypothetical protein